MDGSGDHMPRTRVVITSVGLYIGLLMGQSVDAMAQAGQSQSGNKVSVHADDDSVTVGAKDGYGESVIPAPLPGPNADVPSHEEIQAQQWRYAWACATPLEITPPGPGMISGGLGGVFNSMIEQAKTEIGPGLDCDPQSQAASQAKVREALAHIPLPTGDFYLDPNPDNNEWHAAAVGQNLWFTIDLPDRQHTVVTQDGITITLDAEAYNIRIDLGDSSDTIQCAGSNKRPRGSGNKPSPSCGGAYSKTGTYTLTAEISWQIIWTALGTTGTDTITQQATGTRTLEVIELETVLVPDDKPS